MEKRPNGWLVGASVCHITASLCACHSTLQQALQNWRSPKRCARRAKGCVRGRSWPICTPRAPSPPPSQPSLQLSAQLSKVYLLRRPGRANYRNRNSPELTQPPARSCRTRTSASCRNAQQHLAGPSSLANGAFLAATNGKRQPQRPKVTVAGCESGQPTVEAAPRLARRAYRGRMQPQAASYIRAQNLSAGRRLQLQTCCVAHTQLPHAASLIVVGGGGSVVAIESARFNETPRRLARRTKREVIGSRVHWHVTRGHSKPLLSPASKPAGRPDIPALVCAQLAARRRWHCTLTAAAS